MRRSVCVSVCVVGLEGGRGRRGAGAGRRGREACGISRRGNLPVSAVNPLSFSCHVCWRGQKKDNVRMSNLSLPPVVTGLHCLAAIIKNINLIYWPCLKHSPQVLDVLRSHKTGRLEGYKQDDESVIFMI